MANEVYANNMEVSCKAASGKSICAFPDVCFTPPQTPATPPGVPIPYPNTSLSSDTSDGSSSVTISGQEVMLKNKSFFKKSSGDEAGCAPKKGLINSKVSGKVFFKAWSMDVKIEGENVVRHLDLTTHNHASDIGNESCPWPQIEKMTPPAGLKTKPCEKSCKQGVSKEERDKLRKTPEYDDAMTSVNSGPKPLSCPVCKGTVAKLSPDHIVPINVIDKMPGFACLSKEDQSKVVNHPSNFVGLCRSCNSSKSDTLWHKWKEHKSKGLTFSDGLRDKGKQVTKALIVNLKIMIRSADCA
jgi:5-methylcytosine-specific restriction endonuclease McrA